jgi:hypothetical protein
MKKLKQLSVALVALSTVLMCKSARAQYMRPVPIYVPPPYLNQFDPPNNNSSPTRVSAPRASGYNSRFTRSFIHKLATKDASLRQLLQETLCGNNIRPKIEGTRLSSEEAHLLREELGCP